MDVMQSIRFKRGTTLVVVILLGLWSRNLSFLSLAIGDALWAMAVYLGWGFIFPKFPIRKLALIALVTSYLVEFSQLLTWDWLRALRSTRLGHLFLGQGFLTSDLLAYTIGVGFLYLCEKHIYHKSR